MSVLHSTGFLDEQFEEETAKFLDTKIYSSQALFGTINSFARLTSLYQIIASGKSYFQLITVADVSDMNLNLHLAHFRCLKQFLITVDNDTQGSNTNQGKNKRNKYTSFRIHEPHSLGAKNNIQAAMGNA